MWLQRARGLAIGGTTVSEGSLVGVVDSPAFRDAVLRQREILQEGGASASTASSTSSDNELLVEIRDLLRSIDAKS